MNAVIAVALPVFAITATGLLAGRMRVMTGADAASLNKFVIQIAVPAALFGLTAGAEPVGAKELTIGGAYALAAAVAIFGGYAIGQLLFGLTKPAAGAHGFASTLGNAVFLGLPIALSIEGWTQPFVSLMLIEGIFVIAIGVALMSPRREGDALTKLAAYFAGPLKNPIVLAMIAGIAYAAVGLPFSGPFETFFGYFARAGGAVALFSLGLFLATHPLPALRDIWGKLAAVTAVKLGVLPAIALGAAYALGVSDPDYLGALALFCFVPTGAFAFILASQFGVYQSESAAAVTITALLSVLTISGVLMVYA